ncbi:DUF1272 domain-containing protein [Enterobacter sp.]|uniref:DUF1272 domain-containing protein n=1 Tax=Enterobacter sp. TaxID=42895 RepID=UPI00296FF02E|nr:DUF1272 domain-containing protein [Enterobacter sp.]
MLEMKTTCERCHQALPHDAHAMICSYECTFCPLCAEQSLHGKCPNCNGELVKRPTRMKKEA